MRWRWNTVRAAMLLVVWAALGCMVIREPSKPYIALLLYIKVCGLVVAVFKAKYGGKESRDWWFGFAAFGWGFLALSANNSVLDTVYFGSPAYFQWYDLVGTMAIRLKAYLPAGPGRDPAPLAEVIRFWLTAATGTIGGTLTHLIARRAKLRGSTC